VEDLLILHIVMIQKTTTRGLCGMLEKVYRESFALILDKVAVDHNTGNSNAAKFHCRDFDCEQYTQCKKTEGDHRPEGVWAYDHNQGKENKEKCKVNSRTHFRKKTKQDSKRGGDCFTAFFFAQKWERVPEHRRNENRNKKQRMDVKKMLP